MTHLNKLVVGLVSGFVLDYMHLVCLGVIALSPNLCIDNCGHAGDVLKQLVKTHMVLFMVLNLVAIMYIL